MAGIGFFAPLPLAMMMPFMAGQSMLMGDAFGKSYQYGKRKISAMSNEEFNKLTTADLANDIQADFKSIIPSLGVAVQQSSEFQSLIIQEMGNIIKSLPAEISQFFTGEESTGNNLAGMITIILSKMLNLPTTSPQGNLGAGGAFLAGVQTNPLFPNQQQTVQTQSEAEFIGPLGTIGPPAPPLTQLQLLNKYANWETYRSKGGLLQRNEWSIARRKRTAPQERASVISKQIVEIAQAPSKFGAIGKRPAGQSVRKELKRLQELILIRVKTINTLEQQMFGHPAASNTVKALQNAINKRQKHIEDAQLKIALLIRDYTF